MLKIKWTYIIVFASLLSNHSVMAQEQDISASKKKLSLNNILDLARNNSLDAFKAKGKYDSGYWEYRAYKASLLPKINLELRPFTFTQTLTERFDPERNIDIFRQQQNINSFGNISLSQNIGLTGTRVFINSSLNRLNNIGDIAVKNYFATPFRIGLSQPIMAFNPFKWEKETAPLKYQKDKQNFIYELQSINIKVVYLFFDWALASKKVSIAEENRASAEKLFRIGQKRYELASIERDDLLNLELDVFTANTNLVQNQQDLQKTESELRLFLREESIGASVPELPELISDFQIDMPTAMELAHQNNPTILDLRLRKVEALRDLDKSIKDNRFDLSIDASYGLNRQAETLTGAYSNFLNQQLVSIRLTTPLLDWGERRGNIKTARTNKEVIDIELQQEEDAFRQNLLLKVNNFNLQRQLVEGAQKTSELARESYEITEKRFLSGRIDFLNLTSARQAWQTATERYIQNLQNYWVLFYEVQQLTLYDFMNKKAIVQNFNALLDD